LALLPVLQSIATTLLEIFNKPETKIAIDKLITWIGGLSEEITGKLIPNLATLVKKLKTAWDEDETIAGLRLLLGWIGKIATAIWGIVSAVASAIAALARLAAASAAGGIDSGFNRMMGNVRAPATGGVGRASGGPVLSGSTYLVGERGPELLRMGGSSGMIIPNNRMGGSTYIVNLHVHSVVSLADMDNAQQVLLPIIEDGLRTVMARA